MVHTVALPAMRMMRKDFEFTSDVPYSLFVKLDQPLIRAPSHFTAIYYITYIQEVLSGITLEMMYLYTLFASTEKLRDERNR